MRLCYQPRQRVEQDPGESENPMLILFNNHASMTNFVVGIHSVQLVGLRICRPLFPDGFHTFIPHPGLRTNLTRGYENQAFQAIISRFIYYSGFCGDSSLDQENWNRPSKIPSKSKINPQLKTKKSDRIISTPLLHNPYSDILNDLHILIFYL